MRCKDCGESMEGDGYSDVIHCPNIDVTGMGYEPDASLFTVKRYKNETYRLTGSRAPEAWRVA